MPTRDPAFTDELHDQLPGVGPREDDPRPPRGGTAPRGPLLVALAGALVGALFSALSTSDFMQHLDRQVHAIHCSFIPGAAKEIAESGCRTVMMSPYSSFFREQLWGGIPVSLWSLAVFAFLAYRSALLSWRGRASSGETKVLLAASLLPVVVSVAYGVLSVTKLDALCKVCIGIYAASAIAFVGALLSHRARAGTYPIGDARFGVAFAEGAALVAALSVAYVALAPQPDPKASLLGCGSLVRAEDTAGVMIPLTSGAGGVPAVEVLDPLCPSCKAFDARLAASSLGARLDLDAVLFPLDSTCNWMVTEAIHPGACAVSEAVLCAGGVDGRGKDAAAAGAVLRWAFDRQAELRALATRDERALRAEIERQFPAVKGCLGGALVRSKLTKSLRWAVANAIPVLTPQLFVGGSRVCDEDTDLGLEYTLSRMLSPEAAAERSRRRALEPPRPPPSADVQPAVAVTPPAEAAAQPALAVPARVPPSAPAAERPDPPRPPSPPPPPRVGPPPRAPGAARSCPHRFRRGDPAMNDTSKRWILLTAALAVPLALVIAWAMGARSRLEASRGAAREVATASVANDAYCTAELKAIVRRVAGACGLLEGAGGSGRGCQPLQAKKVAALSGSDFNALFEPLAHRAHIVQFDATRAELDPAARTLVEKAWSDQRGASFFFVVSRASPDGDEQYNEALSRDRAKAVLDYLDARFRDEDLKKQVGLLWLGEEFAQLSTDFCGWERSRSGACNRADINRSAFVAWIDCAI